MAKILYIVKRENLKNEQYNNQVFNYIYERITPDNIQTNFPTIISDNKVTIGIFNYSELIAVHNQSVCMGNMAEKLNNWYEPLNKIPNGNYALFRINDESFEVTSDIVGSRAIWYYFDDMQFIASTSQRAILIYLKSFNFNEQVIPWMLSSGFLGPGMTWDKRLILLPPNSSIILSRKNWTLKSIKSPLSFKPIKKSFKQLNKEFELLLKQNISNIDFTSEKIVLPLSGGVDSRGILLTLTKNKIKPVTITWGSKKALEDSKSDAVVAQKLSNHFNLPHKYFILESADESFEKILNRFLISGEGRIDHLSGYLDGFALWKKMYDEGIQGIIRGDEGFGCIENVFKYSDVFYRIGLYKLSSNRLLANRINIAQIYPEYLMKGPQESLSAWRDRLYHSVRIPEMLSALNDLKLSYVEISNPLLNHDFIKFVLQLNDKYRDRKKFYKTYVKENSPKIPFAKHEAIISLDNYFSQEHVKYFLISELIKVDGKYLYFNELIPFLVNDLKKSLDKKLNSNANLMKKLLKEYTPGRIKSWLKSKNYTKHTPATIIAFRIIIIVRMLEIFEADIKFDSFNEQN